jgi:L-cysteate sulfo-lyase
LSCEQDLQNTINSFPRVQLGFYPTPLHELANLSRLLGGPNIYVKRDDCTGLALGGNKTRHLEFCIGEAIEEKADTLVAGGAIQSNFCRQVAAAAACLNLKCHLILTQTDGACEVQGNFLLDKLLGATIEVVQDPMGTALDNQVLITAQRLKQEGRSPYLVSGKPRYPILAALSYVQATIELKRQCDAIGIRPASIYCAAAGPTQSGLILGTKSLDWHVRIQGIAPIRWDFDLKEDIVATVNSLSCMLGTGVEIASTEILNSDAYVGEGYGPLAIGGREAVQFAAQTEGLLLDPVYTGKAMAALIDHVKAGLFEKYQSVIFLHTGGTPALFAYHKQLNEQLDGSRSFEELVAEWTQRR